MMGKIEDILWFVNDITLKQRQDVKDQATERSDRGTVKLLLVKRLKTPKSMPKNEKEKQ